MYEKVWECMGSYAKAWEYMGRFVMGNMEMYEKVLESM